jgi:dihydropteroate synthase
MAAGKPRLFGLLASRPWPLVMGIVNVTPDSFSDGGRFAEPEAARDHALQLLEDGADILDFGAESTRPGAAETPEEEERARLLPALSVFRAVSDAPLSVDTRKPGVMRAAAPLAPDLWNDVSALSFTPDSLSTAAALGLPVALMHAKGLPATMQLDPTYDDVAREVRGFLSARIGAAVAAGVTGDRLLVDPGVGFGKTLEHNLSLMRDLATLRALGRPILFGASRKRFIAALDAPAGEGERLGGSIAAALWAASQGAAIVRVHDVRETVQALKVWRAVLAG